MPALDAFHQPVALPPEAVPAWDATLRAFLAHGASAPDHLARLRALAPEAVGPELLRGLFLALLARRETVADARAALRLAEPRLPAAGVRERTLAEALRLLLAGEPGEAAAAVEARLAVAPGDTLLLKIGQLMRFLRGDAAGMRRSADCAAAAHEAGHPGRGYALGCAAFAREETGDYAGARIAGLGALRAAPDDAWGLHAVAHVHDMSGDADGGLRWLDGHRAAWAHCNNFRFHVWWHRALMLLDLGRHAEALAQYDRDVRPERTDDYRDIANATSLLVRLELEGVDVGRRWEELAALAEARCADGCLAFADLHYMLALVGGARAEAADRLAARLAAARGGSETAAVMGHPGAAVARGLAAFGAGQYGAAFDAFAAARPALPAIGGSHAQRDVFDRLAVEAGLRAGRLDETEALLRERTRRRGHADGYAARRHAAVARARAACIRRARA
ncbi:tetratricopeptide repeat protein [Jannaschia sp. W003]|uniref:tetratricopeptide repeat protein n=1 Tax=Jannaschia sp. W003 TaxID=2867012 RepID=UPI0021A8DC63|nr:tetratricopeptide repeat protein [Jannaschia sp. W003]UWQ20525.1 tetratricopeptide repeat protein [Jannaschia sp. W003]